MIIVCYWIPRYVAYNRCWLTAIEKGEPILYLSVDANDKIHALRTNHNTRSLWIYDSHLLKFQKFGLKCFLEIEDNISQ